MYSLSHSKMFIFQNLAELDHYLSIREHIISTWKLENTPFVIFYGPFNALKCCVRIDGTNYESINGIDLTPVQAVDICFKSFYALRKNFTFESDCCWIFLEDKVYELKTDIKRKSYKNIDRLLVEFNKL